MQQRMNTVCVQANWDPREWWVGTAGPMQQAKHENHESECHSGAKNPTEEVSGRLHGDFFAHPPLPGIPVLVVTSQPLHLGAPWSPLYA